MEGGSVHRSSADVKENISGQESLKCRDGCEPMRFTDTNLRYDMSVCLSTLGSRNRIPLRPRCFPLLHKTKDTIFI
jgi:hypothetical protein